MAQGVREWAGAAMQAKGEHEGLHFPDSRTSRPSYRAPGWPRCAGAGFAYGAITSSLGKYVR